MKTTVQVLLVAVSMVLSVSCAGADMLLAWGDPAPEWKEVEVKTKSSPEVAGGTAATGEVKAPATPEAEDPEKATETKPMIPSLRERTESEWYKVRVGIFSKKSSAGLLMSKLAAEGYPGFLVQQAGLWRVQVGAFKDRFRAERVLSELRAKGYVADIIVAK